MADSMRWCVSNEAPINITMSIVDICVCGHHIPDGFPVSSFGDALKALNYLSAVSRCEMIVKVAVFHIASEPLYVSALTLMILAVFPALAVTYLRKVADRLRNRHGGSALPHPKKARELNLLIEQDISAHP